MFSRSGLVVLQSAIGATAELMDGSSLSTLVQMVSAGIGITLIPEMAVAVETRSAFVSVARFPHLQPSRTIGMIWRKTSPLAKQLLEISEVVRQSAVAMREQLRSLTFVAATEQLKLWHAVNRTIPSGACMPRAPV